MTPQFVVSLLSPEERADLLEELCNHMEVQDLYPALRRGLTGQELGLLLQLASNEFGELG